jgi:hypothetical protein
MEYGFVLTPEDGIRTYFRNVGLIKEHVDGG